METTRRDWKVWVGVVSLLILHAALGLRAVAGKSVTADEIFHVTGGYLFDRYGDYRIHPDNGVLPQRLHALPAVLAGAKPPPFEGNDYWRASDVYVMSYQFFYESGNDHWPILMRARAMNVLFSLGAGLLVFLWTRRLAGDIAGLTALGLLALSPTYLAHGPLATSDAAAALLLTASAGACWWQLRGDRPRRVLASALVFGLACVAKFSAVLLLPVFVFLTAWHLLSVPAGERRYARTFLQLAGHGVAAGLIIWAFFGFRYTAFAPDLPPADHFIRSWNWMLGQIGWQAPVINLCRKLHLLPEGFLFGYTHACVGAQARAAFLAGEYSSQGWVRFFPLAFLWKSTPAELAGLVLAIIAAALRWRRAREWTLRLAPLLMLAGVYGGVALTSHLNIGHRHLLPLYPALCIVAGIAVMRIAAAPRVRLALAGLLGALQGVEAGRIHPDYLAYFNGFAGGPANGWRLLVDSSLDWGQDLSGLNAWLEAQGRSADGPIRPLFLSYFGSGNPDYYHLDAARLPFVNDFKFTHRWYELTAGVYCVSATMLQQVYSPVRGDWTLMREKEYQELRSNEHLYREYWRNPAAQREVQATGAAEAFEQTWARYDMLRFARLCHYLRARKPEVVIGHSIFIHRLTEAEVAAAVKGNYSDWLRIIERARSKN
ncbi:MAG: phospholipid carrier-dependent glycosyltransferase [Lacunisphaera sp.]|nr:phospholipid carrier-dependent glycosyltransferase [Lacunisphaera sp.]